MANILLTGGRAPATLALARVLHEAGHRLVLVESVNWSLSQFSKVIDCTYPIPAPRQDFQGFLDTLLNIVQSEKIDVVIPTCEETFWVAKAKLVLNEFCSVFCEYLPELDVLHHKWNFVQHCSEMGLLVPFTQLLTQPISDELQRMARIKVFKPVYSRFGTQTLIRPTSAEAAQLPISPQSPWIVQDFVEGRLLCTWSVAHQGKITAHTAYYNDFQADHAAVAFDSVIHTKAQLFAQTLIESTHFTGFMGLDFVEMNDGSLYALECNPRLTSGIHLFEDQSHQLSEAILNVHSSFVTGHGDTKMLAIPMLKYARKQADFWQTFRHSDDVIWRMNDPMPAFSQLFSYLEFRRIAKKNKVSLIEATTFDIEWNGE